MSTATRVLTDEMIAEIKKFFPRYPNLQAVTLPALHIVNDRLRYVPQEAVVEIAALLGLTPAQVQDTLTFYGYFKQDKPHGRVRAWVCRSISCALRDGDALISTLCDKLHIHGGETTADGAITIEPAECLGACELAPCILANEDLIGNVKLEDADKLIERWKNVK